VRRLLIVLLFGLLLAGGATITWQAMGKARLVEKELTTARALLARAGGFESGELKQRLRLVKQAEQHTVAAQQWLGQWPLRQLGALPLVGRDIRVARAVTASATGTAQATRGVVKALQPLQGHAPTQASILRASEALLALRARLQRDVDQVRATRPLLITGSRTATWRRPARPATPPSGPARVSSWPPTSTAPPARPGDSWPSRTRPSCAAPAA
jgi:hypothetical protein